MSKGIGDIVWAKVSGYPDWPGVITGLEGTRATVHFIGDDTHTFSELGKIKLLSEQNLGKADVWLKLSYKAANKLSSPITLDELKEINKKIKEKFNKKHAIKEPKAKKVPKQEKGFEEKIRELFLRLDHKISFPVDSNSRRAKVPAIKKSAEILNSFTIQSFAQSGEYTVEDIIDVLESISELDLSKKLLNCSSLIRILKYFRAFLSENSAPEIKTLVKLTDKLLKYFDKLLVLNDLMENEDDLNENFYEIKAIRGEILMNLKDKGFIGASGTKIMSKIESKIKEIDPSKGKICLEKYNFILKELRRTSDLSLEDLIKKINSHLVNS